MENRVKKYKLNAKKAYEFAAGLREVIDGKDRTRRIYNKRRGRPINTSFSQTHTLTAEEQEVFLEDIEYGYRYAVLKNSRLDPSVEQKFLEKSESATDIKYAINYCQRFSILVPTSLHNRILIQSAIPSDKSGLRFSERRKVRISENKQKKYLLAFQEHKKSFKMILEGVIRDNNLNENNTIKELIESIN